jgi:hypothetical protein
MARSYAQVHQRIWADPAWRNLDVNSQHLYLLLISQPQMNLAGVLPLQLRKWSSCVKGWDIADVATALDQLRADRFVVVDEDTEEVLVRTLIRNDGAYKTPGMLKSILKFAEGVQAPALRATLAVELGKIGPLEGKTAAEGMAAINATRLALVPSGTNPDPGVIHRSDGIGDGIADTFLGTHPGYLPQNASEPIADTSVSVTGSVASLALVRSMGEGSSPALLDEPQNCPKHQGMDRDEIPPCRACGRLREQWEAAKAEAEKPKPLPPWCGRCAHPTDRHLDTPLGVIRCPECNPKASEPVNDWKSA